jgi:hypothetical protein
MGLRDTQLTGSIIYTLVSSPWDRGGATVSSRCQLTPTTSAKTLVHVAQYKKWAHWENNLTPADQPEIALFWIPETLRLEAHIKMHADAAHHSAWCLDFSSSLVSSWPKFLTPSPVLLWTVACGRTYSNHRSTGKLKILLQLPTVSATKVCPSQTFKICFPRFPILLVLS